MDSGEYYIVLMENRYQDVGGIMNTIEVAKIEKDKLKALKYAIKLEIEKNMSYFDTTSNEFSKKYREYIDDYINLLKKIDDVKKENFNDFKEEWIEMRSNFFSAYDFNMCIDFYEGFRSTIVNHVHIA